MFLAQKSRGTTKSVIGGQAGREYENPRNQSATDRWRDRRSGTKAGLRVRLEQLFGGNRKATMPKKILRVFLLLAGSFIVGYLVACVMWYRSSKKEMASALMLAMSETALDVRQLQQGETDAVLKRKCRALPEIVQLFNSVYRNCLPEQHVVSALWDVSLCYDGLGREAPASIKKILDGLPPRGLTSREMEAQLSRVHGVDETRQGEQTTPAEAETPR